MEAITEQLRLALTMKEAVEASRLSRTTLWQAEKNGDLRVTRVGRRVLIEREELSRFLREGGSGRR